MTSAHPHQPGRGDAASPAQCRHRAAFTLIELLVVVAIIGILASLLLPALSRAKQKAYQIQCVNNLKQLATAITLYADDHNDFLPGPAWQGLYHVYDNQDTFFLPYYIATYLGQPGPTQTPQVLKMAICPASGRTWAAAAMSNPDTSLSQPISYIVSITVTNLADDTVTRPFGYPYAAIPSSDASSTNEPTKRLKQIRNPATSWAIVDADQQNALPLAAYYSYISERRIHGSVRNQLYFDSHVEAVKD